jgi:hypothetical protein
MDYTYRKPLSRKKRGDLYGSHLLISQNNSAGFSTVRSIRPRLPGFIGPVPPPLSIRMFYEVKFHSLNSFLSYHFTWICQCGFSAFDFCLFVTAFIEMDKKINLRDLTIVTFYLTGM